MSNPTIEKDLATIDAALQALSQRRYDDTDNKESIDAWRISYEHNRAAFNRIRSRLTAATDDAWSIAVLDAWAEKHKCWLPPLHRETDAGVERCVAYFGGARFSGPTMAAARLAAARALVAEDPSLAPAEPVASPSSLTSIAPDGEVQRLARSRGWVEGYERAMNDRDDPNWISAPDTPNPHWRDGDPE